MTPAATIAAGSALGVTGIILGALGAHGLEHTLNAPVPSSWGTAVQYQLFHALALLLAGFNSAKGPWLTALTGCFALGTLLFSGSIYVLVLGGPGWLGPVTPIGGMLFIVGWLLWLPLYRVQGNSA